MTLPGYVVVQAAPFNAPDDPDSTITWVDISGWTMVSGGAQIPTSSFGRQTNLDQVDPGQFAITLNNADHRFTPGNPTSPYYPGWRTGMRLRMVETVGSRSFTLADGNMLQPALSIQVPGRVQTVTVTAQDRIGRLQQGRKFIGTLAEYVKFNGGTSLVAFWPLADASGSSQATEVTGRATPLRVEGLTIGSASATTSTANLLAFSAAAPPNGDDAQYPLFSPVLNVASSQAISGNRLVCRNLGLSVAGTNLTFVLWLKLDPTNTGTYQVLLVHDNASVNTIQLSKTNVAVGDIYQLTVVTVAGSVTVNGPTISYGTWQLIGIQLTVATGAVTMWVDNVASTGATGGAANGALDIILVDGGSPNSSCAELQIYQDTYTQVLHLAQLAAGRSGLSGQYAGQRISTVMQYAGIPAGELSQVDNGSSMMGPARLAGKTALDLAREAETTEQGLLHAYGRQLIFHGRNRRYNH